MTTWTGDAVGTGMTGNNGHNEGPEGTGLSGDNEPEGGTAAGSMARSSESKKGQKK